MRAWGFSFFLAWSLSASAADFYDYSCDFYQKENSGWELMGASFTNFQKQLGYNSQTQSSNFFMTFHDGFQLGGCAETYTGEPDKVTYAIHFTEGRNLEFAGRGCGFSGDQVRTYSFDADVTPTRPFFFARYEFHADGAARQALIILGNRKEGLGPTEIVPLCLENFRQAVGAGVRLANPESKREMKRTSR